MTYPLARVGDLAEQVRGVTYAKGDASTVAKSGFLPVLRAGNITEDGLLMDDLVFVPEVRISEVQRVRRNDVLVATSSGSIDVVGKAAPALTDLDAGFGTFCKVLRPGDAVNPRYFAQFFKTPGYRARASALAAGANINNLRNEHLDELRIPLPPLPEQRRIANILDRAEALRAQRRAVLEHMEFLRYAVFLEMFGDPVSNPMNWPTRRIADVGEVITGNTPLRSRPDFYGLEIEWIKSDNLDSTRYYITPAAERLSKEGARNARVAPVGAILVTCIAGSPSTIGNAAMTDRPVAFNQQINALVLREGSPHFMFGQLVVGKRLVQQASTASMKGMVNKSRFEAIRLMFPPPEFQAVFESRIAAIEKLKSLHRASLAKLDELFASLQHRAFRGEL